MKLAAGEQVVVVVYYSKDTSEPVADLDVQIFMPDRITPVTGIKQTNPRGYTDFKDPEITAGDYSVGVGSGTTLQFRDFTLEEDGFAQISVKRFPRPTAEGKIKIKTTITVEGENR
ncbi:MAG: hypothetical protein WCP79_07045 [Bacillota bacterium]